MAKTSFRQKIGLFLLGTLLAFILLEIFLRAGGMIFGFFQEQVNRKSLKQYGEYKILCLGESTTALGGEYSYPRQLEKILNERQNKIKFTVINKGIPAITTTMMVKNLRGYLEEYTPDMVVTMIGINDSLTYIRANDQILYSWFKPLYKMRTVKLIRLMMAHGKQRIEEFRSVPVKKKLEELYGRVEKIPTSDNFTKLANVYRAANWVEEERRTLEKALELDPNNFEALGYLGRHYKRMGDYPKAIDILEKAVQFGSPRNPHIIEAYADLAESYKLWEKYDEAERVLIASFPNNPGAYGALGGLYLEQERYAEAEQLFERQLKINPRPSIVYVKLAYCYRRKGHYARAEKLLQSGIHDNPHEIELYSDLAHTLGDEKKYEEAEAIIKKAVELNLEDPKGVVSQWSRDYQAQGLTLKDEMLKTLLKSRQGVYTGQTLDNYLKIRDILRTSNIRMVVAQYPLRSLQPLLKLFDAAPEIIFVDNEKSFQEGVAQERYEAYFTDRFAGDFGHCTPKGNLLLADNIAKVILSTLSSDGL